MKNYMKIKGVVKKLIINIKNKKYFLKINYKNIF